MLEINHDYRIGELDQYLFGQGTHYESIYKKWVLHFVKDGGKNRRIFRSMDSTRQISCRSRWIQRLEWRCKRYEASGTAESIPHLFRKHSSDSFTSTVSRHRPGIGTKLIHLRTVQSWDRELPQDCLISPFKMEWQCLDEAPGRMGFPFLTDFIYEAHISSWMRHPGREWWLQYRGAHAATDYIKKMGYTHIELMGNFRMPIWRLLGISGDPDIMLRPPVMVRRKISHIWSITSIRIRLA